MKEDRGSKTFRAITNCTNFFGDFLNSPLPSPPPYPSISLDCVQHQNKTSLEHITKLPTFIVVIGHHLSDGAPVTRSPVHHQQSRGPTNSFLSPLWVCRACCPDPQAPQLQYPSPSHTYSIWAPGLCLGPCRTLDEPIQQNV